MISTIFLQQFVLYLLLLFFSFYDLFFQLQLVAGQTSNGNSLSCNCNTNSYESASAFGSSDLILFHSKKTVLNRNNLSIAFLNAY